MKKSERKYKKMDVIFRYYIEKPSAATETEVRDVLNLPNIDIRHFIRYDVKTNGKQFVPESVENPLEQLPTFAEGTRFLCFEPVKGQFDALAEVCELSLQLSHPDGERPRVKTAQIYAISGIERIEYEWAKAYLVNPLEYNKIPIDADLFEDEGSTVYEDIPEIDLSTVNSPDELSLAMSADDLAVTREYFKSENRNPTLTEIRVLDTYWSDHCRHTTFNTIIEEADIRDKRVKEAFELFKSVNGDRPATLMNIATAAMRFLKKQGDLPMLDESDEVNACTIKISGERYLFFKNETHNHPTEIEPFGGASTCIGGGIRDPLSGRAYVFQGMRITGAGDPRTPIEETLPGKLPQRRLCLTAAEGFSSYANQIGAATSYVKEIYHPGYVAKRMEAGAIVASADRKDVLRKKPVKGDIVLLLGGRTGRDGIGGATGSSVTHDADTSMKAACEVQKGNPPEERRIQRLFLNPDATRLIKKCNDFGAGGVAVAVGELADGLDIELDKVPLKYDGMNGTEIAISESQERMAVVIASDDVAKMLELCEEEGVEATVIAQVSDTDRLCMTWRGKKIVDIARKFLDTNGAKKYINVNVPESEVGNGCDCCDCCSENCNSDLGITYASQKGLKERFDSSVGGLSVFEQFGGSSGLSESQVMAAVIPGGDEAVGKEAAVMAYGYDPYITEADPFGGSIYAVVSSIAKIVAAGVDVDTIHLSFQEYFPRVNDVPERWGVPFSALLGAFTAQMGLKMAAIGGKDSMSGSFGDLDVPPALISFAVGIGEVKTLVSSEFKGAGNPVYMLTMPMSDDCLPDYSALRSAWEKYNGLVKSGKVLSAMATELSVKDCIRNMALGNMLGFVGNDVPITLDSIIFEASIEALEESDCCKLIGYTQNTAEISFNGETYSLEELRKEWESPLEKVFPPSGQTAIPTAPSTFTCESGDRHILRKNRTPRCVIPVLPGTNGEYDAAAAIERAGGMPEIVPILTLTPGTLKKSVLALKKAISESQMLVLPGGGSSTDLIVSLFKNHGLFEAVQGLLERDGLVLGIEDGFKALLKLGLLGVEGTPVLNNRGHHIHKYTPIKAEATDLKSPWLSRVTAGGIYVQPISGSELRVDVKDIPSSQVAFRYAGGEIEAIVSPDGKVLGKMAHFERFNELTARNVYGDKFLPLFEGAVEYLGR